MRRFIVIAALASGVPLAALAHHGWSSYDASKELRLTGVIRESGYEHPHGHVRLEADGKTWLVVLAPPSRMEHRGLTQAMLAVGNKATVVGYLKRDDPGEMRAERITIADKTVELR
jgi:hypothetical protein